MNILLIGDSHMQALGPRLRARFGGGANVVKTTAHPGWPLLKFVNEGNLTSEGRDADLIIFEVGGNDQPTDRTTYDHRLRVALTMLRANAHPGAKLILVGPPTAVDPPTDARHRASTAQQSALWRDAGANDWIDSRPLTVGLDMRDDDVHFESSGYDAWADALGKRITSGPPASVGTKVLGVGLLAAGSYALWRFTR